MKIIGFSFKKISAEKKKEPDTNLEINTDVKIKDIKKTKAPLLESDELISVDYEFKIEYNPTIGSILFEGNIILLTEDKTLTDEVLNEWEKNKKVPKKLQVPILNTIFQRCHLKALQLEEYVGLHPHIQPPKFTNQAPDSQKEENTKEQA